MDRPTSLREAYKRAQAEQDARIEARRSKETPASLAAVDEAVELSRTNPAAFAALPRELRQRAGDRALNLANRARAEQEASQ